MGFNDSSTDRFKLSNDSLKTVGDRTTEIAEKVVAGEIIAGKPVIDTCTRHIRDLKRDDIVFSPLRANHAIGFLESLRMAEGQFSGGRLRLVEWQVFVVGSVFGWLLPDGFRRFRRAYIEGGKGMGKTPIAGGIALYGLLADNEPTAEVHIAASTEDQAEVCFRDIETFIRNSPDLKSMVKTVSRNRVTLKSAGGFIRTLAFKEKGTGISGIRPHIGIVDEYHEHKTDTMVEYLEMGQKSRRQPLIFIITNSGEKRGSPCWDEHELAVSIASGEKKDDAYFSYVCSQDGKNFLEVPERDWVKTNPALPLLPGVRFLKQQVRRAKNNPAVRNTIRRFFGCEWVGDGASWIEPETWRDMVSGRLSPASDRSARQAWMGYSSRGTGEVAALAIAWESAGDRIEVDTRIWVPRRKAKQEPWAAAIASGDAIRLRSSAAIGGAVVRAVEEMLGRWSVVGMASDPASSRAIEDYFRGSDIEVDREEVYGDGTLFLRDHRLRFSVGQRGQGGTLRMPESVAALERLVVSGGIRVSPNSLFAPILDGILIAENDELGHVPDRLLSSVDISPLLAVLMAVGYACDAEDEGAFPDMSHLLEWQQSGELPV